MSGKLTLETGSGWKRASGIILLSAAAALALISIIWIWLRSQTASMDKNVLTALLALMAYVLFRVFYGWMDRAFPGQAVLRTVRWSLDENCLTLDGQEIPRSSIRQVHCWPNRDALGHSLPGWTVNIETTGKNRLLRSVTAGPGAELSVRQLRELTQALGYGSRWKEEDT